MDGASSFVMFLMYDPFFAKRVLFVDACAAVVPVVVQESAVLHVVERIGVVIGFEPVGCDMPVRIGDVCASRNTGESG